MLSVFRVLVVIAGIAFSGLQGATMHAIVVAHTHDPLVGEGNQANVSTITAFLDVVTIASGLELSLKTFCEDDFNPELVLGHLKGLNVGPDDVVFFYHSSHGFRAPAMEERWPALSFGAKLGYIRLQTIIDIIQNKDCRLGICLADCCNTMWSFTPHFMELNLGNVFTQDTFQENCKELFLYKKGLVVGCGARPGEVAWINTYYGGYFTCSFLQTISQTLNGHLEPCWEQVMRKTLVQTTAAVNFTKDDVAASQHPIMMADIE